MFEFFCHRTAALAMGVLLVIVAVMSPDSSWAASVGSASEPSPGDSAKAAALRADMRKMIGVARDRVFPALVNISVITVDYWGGKEHKGQSIGSGTIISAQGHVLTNQHVTDKGLKFKCRLADKQEVSAELVGEDPLTDLAILKLALSELKDGGVSLSVAKFGDSDELQVGDQVMAMGSPLALSRSVTLGIVSNRERVFGSSSDTEEMELDSGQRTGLFTRWIQHDAMIHPGNSGGPLVNLKGEIVGVNELGGNAIGFAIPSNLARTVADTLIEHGRVPRSWLGVAFKPIEKTGLKEGVLVNSIVQGGPADRAGIQAGDVMLEINGDPVTIRFAEEVPPLMKRIADLPIGGRVRIRYRRGDATGTATIVTDRLRKDRGDETALRSWGFTVEEITEKMARDRRLDSTEGALVSGVRSGGPAQLAEPPLSRGNVIKSIDAHPIADLAALVASYKRIMDSEPLPEYLLVEFDSGGKNHVTLLKPKPPEDADPPREVRKAWIGVATQPVLEKLARKLGDPETRGFRITHVYPHTLAASIDLHVGDIIVSLEGKRLKPRRMQDAGMFARRVRKLEIGKPAGLTVRRDGKNAEVSVDLEPTRVTPSEARRSRDRDFDLTVREVTFFDRDDHRWGEDIHGVIVERVASAGWAGLGGVDSGDLIRRIDSHEVTDRASFRAAMEAVKKAKPERVVFVVLRRVQTRFQFVEPDWKPMLETDRKDQD
ncbi:MAG: PDZ domain-containing protein [Phycisphaerae bacterium]